MKSDSSIITTLLALTMAIWMVPVAKAQPREHGKSERSQRQIRQDQRQPGQRIARRPGVLRRAALGGFDLGRAALGLPLCARGLRHFADCRGHEHRGRCDRKFGALKMASLKAAAPSGEPACCAVAEAGNGLRPTHGPWRGCGHRMHGPIVLAGR